MRFPFFATNRSLDEALHEALGGQGKLWKGIIKLQTMLFDKHQKFLVLEGRVNTLEVWKNHGRKKGK